MARIRSDNRIPQEYHAGSLARLLRLYDDEMNRLTAYQGTVTWDPPNIANGGSSTKAVTVPGCKANTPAAVRVFAPYTLSGLLAGGYVSADDTVTIVLSNTTGGAVDLGSGTWGVLVERMVLIT